MFDVNLGRKRQAKRILLTGRGSMGQGQQQSSTALYEDDAVELAMAPIFRVLNYTAKFLKAKETSDIDYIAHISQQKARLDALRASGQATEKDNRDYHYFRLKDREWKQKYREYYENNKEYLDSRYPSFSEEDHEKVPRHPF